MSLTSEQINELKEAFSLFDRNGDGFITIQEINGAFEAIGISDDNETRTRVDKLDKTRKNKEKGVDFEEFLTLMSPILAGDSLESELLEAFRTFESKPNSSKISVEQLTKILQDEKFSQQDIEELIEDMKPDSNGEIDYKVFVKNLNH